jgi:hypothetical protein
MAPLAAQPSLRIERGQRLRVTIPAAGLIGEVATLRRVTRDTIEVERSVRLFAASDTFVRTAVPITAVSRLEVSTGSRSQWKLGGGVGAVVGGAGGALLGVAAWGKGSLISLPVLAGVGGAALGAMAGALVGAAIGSVIRTESWQQVPLDRLRVSLGPRADGRLAFGAALMF